MSTIFINGKFLGQPTTGAQRFATEMLLALDALLSDKDASIQCDFTLVIPSKIKNRVPPLKHIHVMSIEGPASHLWEQIKLPLFVKNSLLLNLTGSAPILKWKQIITVFDAAVFDFPQAYSKYFTNWYRLLFRVQAKICFGLLTISEFSRSRLCKHLRVANDRFGIVQCGVDHIYQITPDETILKTHGLIMNDYILAVGSANPSKNFAALVEAYSSLADLPSVRLVVVGGSNSSVFSGQQISEHNNTIYTGRIDDAQLKALYKNARGFVFPSLYEGFGIPPLEAMACGCPVLASNAASIPEVCGNSVGYFDPTSIESIRNNLERFISDKSWRLELQESGTYHVKKYSWRNSALQLYSHLMRFGAID